MMNLMEAQVTQLVQKNKNTDDIIDQLNQLCEQYNINSTNRVAMFVAQCLHESGGFRYLSELWGPTAWQKKYENHVGLGNTQPGDGSKFRGRGLIQLTGRKNYQAFADWVDDQSIMEIPSAVASPKYAVLSAIWFWTVNNLNQYADNDDIAGCTRRVNGKQMLGLQERTNYYEALKQYDFIS